MVNSVLQISNSVTWILWGIYGGLLIGLSVWLFSFGFKYMLDFFRALKF